MQIVVVQACKNGSAQKPTALIKLGRKKGHMTNVFNTKLAIKYTLLKLIDLQ